MDSRLHFLYLGLHAVLAVEMAEDSLSGITASAGSTIIAFDIDLEKVPFLVLVSQGSWRVVR